MFLILTVRIRIRNTDWETLINAGANFLRSGTGTYD